MTEETISEKVKVMDDLFRSYVEKDPVSPWYTNPLKEITKSPVIYFNLT